MAVIYLVSTPLSGSTEKIWFDNIILDFSSKYGYFIWLLKKQISHKLQTSEVRNLTKQ